MRLKLFTHIASEHGLSSVTTLIVGTNAAVLINPPLLLQDAHSVIAFMRTKTSNPLAAIFVSHYHPDHYFGADLILEAFPSTKLLAAPYVASAIDREYEEHIKYWSKMLGPSSVTSRPRKPEAYNYTFFVLPDDLTSPIVLLGPLQGSCPDHTVFWLPTENTVVTGDVVFARSTPVLVEEIENSVSLAAWRLSLDLIYSLDPAAIITGHIDKGFQFDGKKDMEHMYRYLDLFEDKVIRPLEENSPKASAQDLSRTFQDAFPACQKNIEFFIGRMATKFGEEGQSSQNGSSDRASLKSKAELEGFVMNA